MAKAALVAPTEDEVLTIAAAFSRMQQVLRSLGTEGERNASALLSAVFQLTELWDEHRPEHTFLAQGNLLAEFVAGLEMKERIGLSNDNYQVNFTLDPQSAAAFKAGQEAAKLNWYVEQRFLNRLLGRKGPLNRGEAKELLYAALRAREKMLARA